MTSAIDLSVLVCTTNTRYEGFGLAIQDQIWSQIDSLSMDYRDRIEVLILNDNKKMMLGRKRNLMVEMAQGKYVQFIDDDDRIEPDMFRLILDATEQRHLDPDVITFLVSTTINGGPPKLCRYSIDFERDRDTEEMYERLPNHICVVKRELAIQAPYPHIVYGEDSGFAKMLRPLLKTEYHIPKVLYRYDYNSSSSETQVFRTHNVSKRPKLEPVADIVIMSNASSQSLRFSTQKTIDTALSGANMLPVNIIVVEQQHGIGYLGAKTIYMPQEFNYNRFANMAAELGSAPWIVVANNDLVFHDGWLHALLAAENPVVSPKCPNAKKQEKFLENTPGFLTGQHLSGWCFMISRELWRSIGGFDDCVSFWCADDVIIQQVKAKGVAPVIVPSSVVEHAVSQTLRTKDNHDDLTWGQLDIFIKKYGYHELQDSPGYLAWRSSRQDSQMKNST